ncbi:DUF2793 domain-containing protein [Thalassovita taeanensis]|uniref:DUF2793 domain-containing protein n=1 Tax=Thalassovita taeanensis TaxID=657014 RepID=A0A1H9KY00_9RHOB|nr:DUF2793 domain-containing protein [Thalassovita taeanensis]SER03948.1 Protein of unknown function [Thalassovita taeanensis]
MSQLSPRVELPYLQPSQAQKHVTHNEALQRLDAVTQLSLQAFSETIPPEPSLAGEMYGIGPGATGGWAGQDGTLAYWDGAAWLFITPQEGWRAWGVTEQELRVWRDNMWQSAVEMLQNLTMLGIGTSADSSNRLALGAEGALFSHAGAGHRISINKASAEDTASVLFQSGWAGHAEMGLAGDNAFALKISSDGQSWQTALRADPDAEEIALSPAGTPRMVLQDGALQVDVPVTGTAVQSSVKDTSVGRLLKVGAFGLGGAAAGLTAAENLDDIAASGLYYNPLSANTTDNNYPEASAGSLLVIYNGPGACVQYFTVYGANRTYIRSRVSGGWSDWSMLYGRDTLVGTVSQAASVPTGAIIERGSNSNGDYVRFADGTQICTIERIDTSVPIDIEYLGGYRSVDVSWTYPASFLGVPFSIAMPVSGSAFGVSARTYGSAGIANFVFTAVTAQSATDRRFRAAAIGRWF